MKRILINISLIAIIIAGVALTSCTGNQLSETEKLQGTSTAAMQTVEALGTRLAIQPTDSTRIPTNTPYKSPTPITATSTPKPTKTLTPPPSPAPILNTCDQALFISETIGDKIVMAPATFFTKTWTLQNTGTCTWTKDYRLVFESGEIMGAAESMPITSKNIEPGGQVTLSVKMVSPAETGNFLGFWKLENESGYRFGLGPEGNAFWVNINVAPETTDEFKVTSATSFAVPNSYTGPCGKDGYPVTLVGQIKTNRAGTVKYTWLGSDGAAAEKSQTIVFFGADQLEVYRVFRVFKGSHSGWARLSIDEPNNQVFARTRFDIICTY